jgi:hypothetical protein
MSRRVFDAQLGDRVQDLAAMANQGDTQILEVVGSQVRQQPAVTAFSRNAASYRSRPSARSQSATFIAALCPSRTAGRRVLRRPYKDWYLFRLLDLIP